MQVNVRVQCDYGPNRLNQHVYEQSVTLGVVFSDLAKRLGLVRAMQTLVLYLP
jgi:hypothetical protein